MNLPKIRNRNDIALLLLLPAPLTGFVIIFAAVYAIASGVSFSTSESAAVDVAAPTRTLSSNAIALATVNAAPIHPVSAPDISGEEGAEVAAALGYEAEFVERGQVNFQTVCVACHGVDARGLAGLGKTLVDSEFISSHSDQELLDFIIVGRRPFDPENTTFIDMPARGGNPGLTDDDILSIIAYIRVLNGEAGPGGGAATTTDTASEPATTDSTTTGSGSAEFTPIDVDTLLGNDNGDADASDSTEFTPIDVDELLGNNDDD